MFPYEETGRRILALRKERGYTREKLAELSDISVQFLADIEKGKKNMTVTTLRKLSQALMTSSDYIINGVADTDPLESQLLMEFRNIDACARPNIIKIVRLIEDSLSKTK